MYEEIKQNLIDHFLKPFYLWATCSNKKSILGDIQKRCPFPTDIIGNGNVIHMNLGDDINLCFDLKWEERTFENMKHTMTSYRLISIS